MMWLHPPRRDCDSTAVQLPRNPRATRIEVARRSIRSRVAVVTVA